MNRVHNLSRQEVLALEQLRRETTDSDLRTRCDAILWSNEGLSPSRIGRRSHLSRCTVVRYILRYQAEGIAGLFTKPRSGRPRLVTPRYEACLAEAAERQPRSLGLFFPNWTTANLADYLAGRTGIVITGRQVGNYLKARNRRQQRPDTIDVMCSGSSSPSQDH